MFANDPAIRENIPLAPLTTLRVGGPARYFLHARNCDEVETGVRWARERDLPILVLGGGSNLVVADEGYPGLVLRVGVRGVESHVRDGVAEIVASAGEPWTPLVSFAVNHGWAGIECLAGIPGFVGATPVQNVGAYGQEVRETIAWVEAFDTETFETVIFHNEACQFEYRDSRFKQTDYGRYLILRVCYHLLVGGPPTIRYGELERFFATENILTPTIADVHMAVLDIRRRKSMIHDHSDPNTRSAGSFFVNPIMTIEEYSAFEDAIARHIPAGERIPAHQLSDGRIKVPAAWLIEHAGYTRGHQCGNVGLSSKHTLALVNYGHATAEEIIALAKEIRDRVQEIFGITLMHEPTFVGVSFN